VGSLIALDARIDRAEYLRLPARSIARTHLHGWWRMPRPRRGLAGGIRYRSHSRRRVTSDGRRRDPVAESGAEPSVVALPGYGIGYRRSVVSPSVECQCYSFVNNVRVRPRLKHDRVFCARQGPDVGAAICGNRSGEGCGRRRWR